MRVARNSRTAIIIAEMNRNVNGIHAKLMTDVQPHLREKLLYSHSSFSTVQYILALSSITTSKSFITPTYSGKPTFPVPFLDAVAKASFISLILLPYAEKSLYTPISLSIHIPKDLSLFLS